MQGVTKGSVKTTWLWFAAALMIAAPQIQAALASQDAGESVNWWSVLLAVAVAVAGYFTRDNDVPSAKAGAE